jgi:hypothetical protein
VSKARAYGFTVHCRVHDGTGRLVSADWHLIPGTSTVNGKVTVVKMTI